MLAGLALALAWAAQRASLPELGWLVYPLLAAGGLKLLLEDMREGRPATLVASLALYGAVRPRPALAPTRRGPRRLRARASGGVVLLVLATWGAAFVAGGRRPTPDLGPFLRRAFPGARVEAIGPGLYAARRGDALLGYATTGTADGYSGPLTVAVAAGPDGRLRALALVEHHDTPVIVRSGERLMRSMLGKGPGDPFRVGADVDAVSGATHTSRGLALASLAAARAIAERASARAAERGRDVSLGAPEIVLAALLVAGAVGKNRQRLSARARRTLRIGTLVGGLVALGFVFAQPWTIAFPIRLLSGDWPSWRTHLYWYALLGAALLAFARAGKSPYCPWVCPFGAAQDALGLLGGARRRRLPRPRLFAWVKGLLLWLAVLLGLLYRNPAAASYEVFGAFFRLSGTGFQYAVLVVCLAAAVFFTRPFCHWVCPVDAIEEQPLRPLRRWIARGGPPALRPLRLAVRPDLPDVPVLRRLRNRLTVAAGCCAPRSWSRTCS